MICGRSESRMLFQFCSFRDWTKEVRAYVARHLLRLWIIPISESELRAIPHSSRVCHDTRILRASQHVHVLILRGSQNLGNDCDSLVHSNSLNHFLVFFRTFLVQIGSKFICCLSVIVSVVTTSTVFDVASQKKFWRVYLYSKFETWTKFVVGYFFG